MFDWKSKKRKEQERKQAHEEELRASLSEKLSRYEEERENTVPDDGGSDHTELVLNGRRIRVAKNQITITDIDT